MNFRDKIKEICKQKGIKQKELAEKLGITDNSLNKTLRGDYPQLQTLERISKVLDVPLKALFDEEVSKPQFVCPHCGKEVKIEIKK